MVRKYTISLMKVYIIDDKDTLKPQEDTAVRVGRKSQVSGKELVPSLNVCTTNLIWIQLISSPKNAHNNQSMAPHLRSLLSASLNWPLRENIQLRHFLPSHQLLCVFSCKNCFMLSVCKCSRTMSCILCCQYHFWASVYVQSVIWLAFRKHFCNVSIKT